MLLCEQMACVPTKTLVHIESPATIVALDHIVEILAANHARYIWRRDVEHSITNLLL